MKRILLTLTLVLFIAPIAKAQDLPTYVPTEGLVAYYPFNGNANDESGNGNQGTVNGATLTSDRDGNEESAFYFSGSNCSTRIDANVDMSTVLNSMTVSMWINKTGDGCIFPRVFDFYDGGDSSNDWGEAWGNNTNFNNVSSIVNSNVWYQLVITTNTSNNEKKYYVNGILEKTTPFGKTLPLSGDLSIGRMNHPAYDAFNGVIDDFGIWNRALTEQEIQNLYTSSTGDIILNGVVSAENNQIKNVADPTDAQDAVTKNYTYSKTEVDALIANLQQQINEMNQTITSSELEGNWNVKELYYLNPDTNEITSTFPTPECSKPYQYYEFLQNNGLSKTGIGTNWATQQCTSSPYPETQVQYTISIVDDYTYISWPRDEVSNNEWQVLERVNADTIIVRYWRDGEISLYNNQVYGLKLVKEARIEQNLN